MFVPGKPFQSSLMFLGEAGAYPSKVPFRCSTLGLAPGLNHKHETRQERLAGTNPVACYEKSKLTAVKSFVTRATALYIRKLLCFVTFKISNIVIYDNDYSLIIDIYFYKTFFTLT